MIRLWISGIITLMLFYKTLSMTDYVKSISLIYVIFILLILSVGLFKKITLKVNYKLIILMFIFIIFGAIASLINQDINVILRTLMFFIMFISLGIMVPSYYQDETEKAVIKIVFISQVPILIIPILMDGGIDRIPYRGIFINPNSLGLITVTVLSAVLAIFFNKIENISNNEYKGKTKFHLLFYIIIISLLLLLITFTSSRTSFVTAIVAILFGFCLYSIHLFKKNILGNFLIRSIIIIPISLLMIYLVNRQLGLSKAINENIVDKFNRKSDNLLSSRDYIWSQVIEEAGFFGGGTDFFKVVIGQGSHNTFITFLGTLGWIPTLIFILLLLMGLYYILKEFLKSNSDYKYFAPITILTFITLSMGEDTSYEVIMLLTFILLGHHGNTRAISIMK